MSDDIISMLIEIYAKRGNHPDIRSSIRESLSSDLKKFAPVHLERIADRIEVYARRNKELKEWLDLLVDKKLSNRIVTDLKEIIATNPYEDNVKLAQKLLTQI